MTEIEGRRFVAEAYGVSVNKVEAGPSNHFETPGQIVLLLEPGETVPDNRIVVHENDAGDRVAEEYSG